MRSRSKLASHYAWGTNGVCECMVDVKAYMDSDMASNGSGFTVTWTILKNHFLEVGHTKPRNHGTPNAHNRWFILFYHMWGPTWIKKFIEIAFGWGPNHIWFHTTLEGPWPHFMMLEVCWDGLWTLFTWALTISWSRLLARVWSGPSSCHIHHLIGYGKASNNCTRTNSEEFHASGYH